jgi:4-amino-4-deoxy-L-arabinose transferase-like glycosyltransferase
MNSDPAANQSPKRVPVFGTLLLAALAMAAVSVIWLLHSARNYQETFNLTFAAQGTLSPVSQTSPDDPMPLYFWLLHGLAHVFSPSLVSLRIASLVCYLLLLPALYIAGKRATGDRRIGLLAAILTALSPFMLWYGNRATVYALLTLVTVISQYLFVCLLQRKRWAWAPYLIVGLIGLGLHYFFTVILLVQVLFYLVKQREFSRRELVYMLCCTVVFAAAFGLWMHYLADTVHIFAKLPYTAKPSATNAFIIYVQYLFGFQAVSTTTFVIAFWPLLVVFALLAVQKYVRPPIAIQYYSFTAFMPLLLVFALSWVWRPLFLSSYFIVCLPSFMLLVSWYLVAFELRALSWARTLLILLMVAMLAAELANVNRAVHEDYLGAQTIRLRHSDRASFG